MAEESYWTRIRTRHTTTRRQALGVFATGLGGAFLAACSGSNNNKSGNKSSNPTSAAATVAAPAAPASPRPTNAPQAPAGPITTRAATPAAEQPVRGGTLRLGTFLSVLGIDPHIEVSIGLVWDAKMYSYLGGFANVTQKFNPIFADSIEQPSPTEFTFKLKQGVKFHNLDPVNGREQIADDVKYSHERFRDLPQAQNNDFFKGVVDKLDVIDKYTYKVTTKFPYAESLSELGGIQTAIVPHEAVEKFKDLSTNAIGAGPYILDQYSKGEKTVLKRNPDYFNKDVPYLDVMSTITILDTNTLIQAYKSDQLDINGAILTKLDFEDLKKNDKLVNTAYPALYYGSLGVNASVAPYSDKRVRQALWMGIDRQQFIDKIGQGDGVLQGILSNGLSFWVLSQAELKPYLTPDVAKAKALLAAAGFPNGFDMTIETSGSLQIYIDYADILVSELKKLGINAKLNLSDLPSYLSDKLFKGNFNATVFTHNPYETPKIPIGFYYKNGLGSGSWWHYDNEDISKQIDAEVQELDLNKRLQMVKDVQKALLDDAAPLINFISPVSYDSYNKRVGGYDVTQRGWQNFRYSEFLKPNA
ncbi:MAG TPA: ABC transporter substrate-binding protein [Dehalococcoidia bacterium]|nr:ABC transporter substrate-binding protein [Dehalococcoidia bacterium]